MHRSRAAQQVALQDPTRAARGGVASTARPGAGRTRRASRLLLKVAARAEPDTPRAPLIMMVVARPARPGATRPPGQHRIAASARSATIAVTALPTAMPAPQASTLRITVHQSAMSARPGTTRSRRQPVAMHAREWRSHHQGQHRAQIARKVGSRRRTMLSASRVALVRPGRMMRRNAHAAANHRSCPNRGI